MQLIFLPIFPGMRPAMILASAIDFSQVFAGKGMAIAATGMIIVFTALLLITLFISALPRLLEMISTILPEVPDHHAPKDASRSLLPDEAILAAIGFVLHTEMQREVGAEETAQK
jgi:Na+-transporting methylmalonyl-CoA/oxaloacetate decarboxylase gamma subunit